MMKEAIGIVLEIELKRLNSSDCYFKTLAVELQKKRDFLVNVLKEIGMKPIVPLGGYFLVADWSALGM